MRVEMFYLINVTDAPVVGMAWHQTEHYMPWQRPVGQVPDHRNSAMARCSAPSDLTSISRYLGAFNSIRGGYYLISDK